MIALLATYWITPSFRKDATMLCGRIIAVSLLLVSLSWTGPSRAQNSHRESTEQRTGNSFASRLASLRSPFHKEEPRSSHAKRTKSQAANSRSAQRSSPTSGKRPRKNTQTKQQPAPENSLKKSTRSMLDKMNVSNLLPSSFFSRKKSTTSHPPRKQTANHSQRPQYQTRSAIPKQSRNSPQHARSNSNGSRNKPEQLQVKPGIRVERPRTAIRRSPDMGSRQGELESALTDLLDPRKDLSGQENITKGESADSLDVVPPRATSSEPLPGFLSDITQSDTAQSEPSQSKPTIPARRYSRAKRTTQVNNLLAKPRMQGKTGRQSSITHHAPLDLRRALQEETFQDTLAQRVADATAAHDTTDSQPQAGLAPPDAMVANKLASKRFKPNHGGNQLRSTTPLSTPQGKPSSREISQVVAGSDHATPAKENTEVELLLSYQQPMIESHVEGPKSILVGREANYRIILRNQGDTAANSLIVTIRIPAWAEVIDATSSRGIVQKAEPTSSMGANEVAADAIDGNSLQWRIQQLEPNGTQALNLRLVPHRGRAMQLGVSWVHSSVGSTATVEVQEPKLQMAISGPDDVLFGKPQRYRLTLSNPGTGIAEEVRIQLVPPGGNTSSATTHEIGSLQPGETQTIDLELTAREAGDLQVQALAFAAGNLRTETTKHLFCRKPELELDWRGPDTKYAGTEATYYFRIRNSGTAPTDPMLLKLQLPNGVKFMKASEGQSFDAQKRHVTWQLTGLNPQEERYVQVHCRLEQAGPCIMQLTAHTAAGELQDEKSIETKIIALADLKLEVTDPRGPIPVGKTAIYEIRITNRGTSHAQGVNIVGLFSEGIDPISVEGAQYSIRDGRVSFQTIKSLPAGRDIVLRIHAKASQPGMHLFRAEVACQDLDIKLSSEEMTRFFEDDYQWAEGSTPYMAERKVAKRHVEEAPVIRR